jgi:hypothetical protein
MKRTTQARPDGSRYPLLRGSAVRWSSAAALLLSTTTLGGCLVTHHGVATLRGAQPQQELVLDLPAVDLSAASDHAAVPQPDPLWTVWPEDAWLHGFTVEVVNGQGELLPAPILHHVKIMTPGNRELFSPIMLRLMGAGSETRAGDLPHSMGVPIQAGDSLLATAMVHNPFENAFSDVRVRVRLRYTPRVNAPSVMAVFPFFMHVTPPGEHSGYDLPPGRSERSWEARPAIGGRVIALGGHTHRYGTELRLEDVQTGRVLWRSTIRLDADGNVVSIPRSVYRWRRGIPLDPSRLYRVTAVFHNPTPDTLRDAGMGTVGGALRPAAAWPAADRIDELYLRDRASEEMGSGHHDHSHGHHH